MRDKPKWYEAVESEFNEVIDKVLTGMEAYRGLMEDLERKAASEKELADPQDEEWIAAMDKVIATGKRGQETANFCIKRWRCGPADDLSVMSYSMPWDDSWDD